MNSSFKDAIRQLFETAKSRRCPRLQIKKGRFEHRTLRKLAGKVWRNGVTLQHGKRNQLPVE